MPKQGVFTLVGPNEGKTMVINDRYPFTDGVFKTQAAHAPLMARILCQYYACELTYEGTDEAKVPEDGEGSLAVSSTRGLTEGQKIEAHDLNAKLALAASQVEAEKEIAAKAVVAGTAPADKK